MLNVEGYYDKLIEFVQHARGEGFVRPEYVEMLLTSDNAEQLLDAFASYCAPADKWS